MDKEVFIDGVFGINTITIRELIGILEKYYCGKIGVQFMHIQDKEQRDWIMDKIENIKPDEKPERNENLLNCLSSKYHFVKNNRFKVLNDVNDKSIK